jgi:hypothetical protein
MVSFWYMLVAKRLSEVWSTHERHTGIPRITAVPKRMLNNRHRSYVYFHLVFIIPEAISRRKNALTKRFLGMLPLIMLANHFQAGKLSNTRNGNCGTSTAHLSSCKRLRKLVHVIAFFFHAPQVLSRRTSLRSHLSKWECHSPDGCF